MKFGLDIKKQYPLKLEPKPKKKNKAQGLKGTKNLARSVHYVSHASEDTPELCQGITPNPEKRPAFLFCLMDGSI